jgi:hypothetical protein
MPELTRAMIDEGMARAEKIACRPSDDCCYAFPDPLEDTRKTCTPKGRSRIGWILANTGRDSWDVWLDGHTGAGRLRRQTRAGLAHSRSTRILIAGETIVFDAHRRRHLRYGPSRSMITRSFAAPQRREDDRRWPHDRIGTDIPPRATQPLAAPAVQGTGRPLSRRAGGALAPPLRHAAHDQRP